ncbi:MAG: VOC family protein [Polyangiales bacterium]
MSTFVRTCLWFESRGEEAAHFYVGLVPNSAVTSAFRPDPKGPALAVEFHLDGVPYQILNGGPHYVLSPAASISVLTDSEDETDRYWDALLADGGKPSRCNWLEDRFGLSWQIVPRRLLALMADPDPAAAKRVRDAMMPMVRIDLAALEAARG